MISHVYCENCIKLSHLESSWLLISEKLCECEMHLKFFLMHKKFSSLENDLYSLSHEKNYISYYGRRSSLNFKIYVKERKREKNVVNDFAKNFCLRDKMCNTTVQHIKEVLYAGGIWSSNCGIYEREELQSHSKLGGPLKKTLKPQYFIT